MSERVTMPALGESVTEGTVTRWLKNVGDTVEVDEPLLEVTTDKVDTEIPSPVAGTLQEILVSEDDTVPVGADLAVIGDGAAAHAEQAPAQPVQEQAAAQPVSEAAPQEAAPEQSAPAQPAQPASGGGEVSGGTTVTMPALGESVTEGTVTRWLKAEGDQVEVDEPLLEVSTDKVDTEIPSPVAGTLTKILVSEDDTVPVGADLAIVGGEAAAAPAQEAPKQEAPKQEAAAPAPQAPQQEAPQQEAPAPAPQAAPAAPAPAAPAPAAPAAPAAQADSGTDASAYVTPLVRKLAAENNVDLGSLRGTGVGGRIRKQDVLEAAEKAKAPAPAAAPAAAPSAPAASAPSAPAVSPKRGTTEKMSRLRKVIAQRMVESLQVSAQLTTVVEVDVTKIARLRGKAKGEFERREGVKLSYLPFLALAAVEALKAHPNVNASVEGDQITYHGQENLGIAVDTERGLLVPVIKNAGDLNIAGLARGIADLAER
ncbi:MAG: 2-oxoglutarate dehydrogenase, E2 component, dihydrolipoamide succinyltransferase, partial [Oryzihumus sp.]